MQQGGAPSVFAPNPQPYRAPLQGLNPNVFQYDVRTQPLDTSNLIQVMQTKDTMDIKREQAALEREKMKADADLAKQKLEYAKAKDQIDFSLDMMKKFGKFDAINTPIPFQDYTMSNRYKEQYVPIIDSIRSAEEGLLRDMTQRPLDNRTPELLRKGIQGIESMKSKISILPEWELDSAARKKAEAMLVDPKGDERVYPPEYLRTTQAWDDYYNGMKDNKYKMNFATNPALSFNQKTEATKIANDLKIMNTPQEATSFSDVIAVDPRNRFIEVEGKKVVPDADTAARVLSTKWLADPKTASFVSTQYGIDLHDPSLSFEDKQKVLMSIIKPQLEFDDELVSSYSKSYRTQLSSPNEVKVSKVIHESNKPPKPSKTTHEIIVSGGTTKTKVGGWNSTFTTNAPQGGGVAQTQQLINDSGGNTKSALAMFVSELSSKGYDVDDPKVSSIINKFIISPINQKKIAEDYDITLKSFETKLKDALVELAKQKGDAIIGTNRPTSDMFKDNNTSTTKPSAPTKKKTALEILREKREKEGK